MARSLGRVIVAKVDSNGKRIKGKLADWIKKHPDEMYFDSVPEWEVWDYLQSHNIAHVSKKEIILYGSCDTTEFKPSEKGKPARIVETKQRPMKFTPDYWLPEYDVYIEVKGYAEEAFKMRWKLFKLAGYTGYLVYSLKDFTDILKLLEEQYQSSIKDQ